MELNQYIAQNSTGNDSDRQKYREKQKELERNKANLVEAISQTGLQDVFAQKLVDIEAELKAVTSLLHSCDSSHQTTMVTEDMVRGYLGSFREFVLKRDIPQIKKFNDSYVERVDVYKEKVIVTFKVALSDGLDQSQTLSYRFEKDTNRQTLKTA